MSVLNLQINLLSVAVIKNKLRLIEEMQYFALI